MVLPSTGPWMFQYRLAAKMCQWFNSDVMILGVSPTFWLDMRPATQKDSMLDTMNLKKSLWLKTHWGEPTVCSYFAYWSCRQLSSEYLPYTHKSVLLSTLLIKASLCYCWELVKGSSINNAGCSVVVGSSFSTSHHLKLNEPHWWEGRENIRAGG